MFKAGSPSRTANDGAVGQSVLAVELTCPGDWRRAELTSYIEKKDSKFWRAVKGNKCR
jgi:hypothetical protein